MGRYQDILAVLLVIAGVFGATGVIRMVSTEPASVLRERGAPIPLSWEGAYLGGGRKACRKDDPINSFGPSNRVYDETIGCNWYEYKLRVNHPYRFVMDASLAAVGLFSAIWWFVMFNPWVERSRLKHADPDVQALIRGEISLEKYAEIRRERDLRGNRDTSA